jgi:uncharacterized SAM-binding protein YcdF (DUF218 family)
VFIKKGKSSKSGLGCGYIFLIGLVVIGLLAINGFLVKVLLDASLAIPEDLRVTQALQFSIPVTLIFVEFWLFDFYRKGFQR